MTPSILALDLSSSRTGAALWGGALRAPASMSKQFPESGEDVGWPADLLMQWLDELIGMTNVETVVYEAPYIGQFGPMRKKNIWTAMKLLTLAGVTEVVCRRRRVKCFRAHHGQVLKHFVGKGNLKREEGKRAVMNRCRELGWRPDNNDEADALAVLDYAVHMMKITPPWAEALKMETTHDRDEDGAGTADRRHRGRTEDEGVAELQRPS